jgi:hypothetical protein
MRCAVLHCAVKLRFVPLQQWRGVLDVNLQGPLAVTQVSCSANKKVLLQNHTLQDAMHHAGCRVITSSSPN